MNKVLSGALVLVGGAVGAGFLGIPYAMAKSGFTIGMIELVLAWLASMFMCFYVLELVLRVRKTHQVVGLVEPYLGKKGKHLMAIMVFIGIYGALVAYGIGVGQLAYDFLGYNPLPASIEVKLYA